AWLCGIASNAARNAVRGRRRHDLRAQPLSRAPELPARTDPEAETRDRAERVAVALAALPDHYEAVLRAKYLDRQTVDEIATAREDTPKAVEPLLPRARQASRDAYETPA